MSASRPPAARAALRILVVHESERARQRLGRLLSRRGHAVILTDRGRAADRCGDGPPDLMLMALGESHADGFETVARIRASHPGHRVPAVYLVEDACASGLLRAIEASGDDYLAAAFRPDALDRKLRATGQRLALQREHVRRQALLERYLLETEQEQAIAGGLMRRLVQLDTLSDPAVGYRLTPVSHLSGDVIAAARTPSGTLHVLLADGTGHGLTASLGVMPVVQPFYAMTRKGFGIAAIAHEVNRKVREWLPVGRFVAATLIAVEPRSGYVSVWNGGNPPALLLAGHGTVLHQFVSRHLPLGLASADHFDARFEQVALTSDAQLIACSDGVIEALSETGAAFGSQRVLETAVRARNDARLRALNDALDTHIGAAAPLDDLSLVVVDCSLDDPPAAPDRAAAPMTPCSMLRTCRIQLRFEPDDLRRTDVTPMLVGLLERIGLAPVHRENVYLVLAELYHNALDHGVLLLDSRLKDSPAGMDRYLALRAKRLACLSEGWIEVDLHLLAGASTPLLRIRVTDSGEGFEGARCRREAPHAGRHGRGLALIRALCMSLQHLGRGNEAIALYALAPSATSEEPCSGAVRGLSRFAPLASLPAG